MVMKNCPPEFKADAVALYESRPLVNRGETVNHKCVARIMRASGIKGIRLRRRHRTTVPGAAADTAPDLIGRDFNVQAPNTKYAGGITYLPVEGGRFCCLATVIDLASRRLAGWAIAGRIGTSRRRRAAGGRGADRSRAALSAPVALLAGLHGRAFRLVSPNPGGGVGTTGLRASRPQVVVRGLPVVLLRRRTPGAGPAPLRGPGRPPRPAVRAGRRRACAATEPARGPDGLAGRGRRTPGGLTEGRPWAGRGCFRVTSASRTTDL